MAQLLDIAPAFTHHFRALKAAMPALTAARATMLLCCSAVLFGLVPLFARFLLDAGVDSAGVAFARFAFSAMIMLPFMPRRWAKLKETTPFLVAGLVVGLGWIFWLESLKSVSVSTASIVYMAYPLFTVLLAWMLRGERPTPRSMLSAGLVLAATLLAMLPGGDGISLGPVLMALPAPIAFGFVVVVVSKTETSLNAAERMAAVMIGATLGLLPVTEGNVITMALENTSILWLMIGIGAVTALVPQLIFSYCAPVVGPARTAACGAFELIVMFAVGFFVFAEQLGLMELMAGGLVILSVLIAPSRGPVQSAIRPVRRRRKVEQPSALSLFWQGGGLHPETMLARHKVPARFMLVSDPDLQ